MVLQIEFLEYFTENIYMFKYRILTRKEVQSRILYPILWLMKNFGRNMNTLRLNFAFGIHKNA